MATEPQNVLPLANIILAEILLPTAMSGQSHVACPPTWNPTHAFPPIRNSTPKHSQVAA